MDLVRNSKCLLRNFKCLPVNSDKVDESYSAIRACWRRLMHRKSLPPSFKEKKKTEVEEVKENEILPIKVNKIQRDIFGATILPQNLSFENAKKLSNNQVRLKDIPLVDENEAAEQMASERQRGKKVWTPKESESRKSGIDIGAEIKVEGLTKHPKELNKSVTELFWVADPYETIPGPRILKNFVSGLKHCVRQLTVASLFLFVKSNALAPFRACRPIVKLPKILGEKIVLISRPEIMSAIFEQDQHRSLNSTLDSVQQSRLQSRGKGENVGHHMSKGWELLRKSMSEASVKQPEKYFDGVDEASSKFVRRIRSVRNRQNEVPDDFLFEINKWSLECLCSVIFDESFGFLDRDSVSRSSKTSEILYSLTVATKNLCHLETGFQFWRFMNTSSLSSLGSACYILESIISEHVGQVQLGLIKRDKRNKNLNEGSEALKDVSLVEGLLLRRDLPPDDIVSSILDILLIGTNTTSVALAFLFYHLARNPRAQWELWKEVKEILPEKYSRLEHEQLSSLKYLQACLKESLRLKMPLPVLTRVLSKNVVLNNYQIPEGTFVLMTAQVEGMKGENFDDPAEFLPERWLDQDKTHPFTSLPVTNYFDDSSPRQIAEASIWVCASQVARHFRIEYPYGEIEATSTAISFPNKPLKFTFVDRKENPFFHKICSGPGLCIIDQWLSNFLLECRQ